MLGGNKMANQLAKTGSGHLHRNLKCSEIRLKEFPKGPPGST